MFIELVKLERLKIVFESVFDWKISFVNYVWNFGEKIILEIQKEHI